MSLESLDYSHIFLELFCFKSHDIMGTVNVIEIDKLHDIMGLSHDTTPFMQHPWEKIFSNYITLEIVVRCVLLLAKCHFSCFIKKINSLTDCRKCII